MSKSYYVPLKISVGIYGRPSFKYSFRKNLGRKKIEKFCDEKLFVHAIFHTGKPKMMDLDNMVKSLLDAMQGLFFKNDRQVKRILAELDESEREEGVSFTISTIL